MTEYNKKEHKSTSPLSTEKESPPVPESSTTVPLWQQLIGIILGTAVGGVIYGIFLQALLIQSLVLDKKPLDPKEWKEKLSGRAWLCGILSFLTMILVPFKYIQRETGATVSNNNGNGETEVTWFLVTLILIVQVATVCYATMRKELCNVEHPSDIFEYLHLPSRYFRIPFCFSSSSSTRTNSRSSNGGASSVMITTTKGSSYRSMTNPLQSKSPYQHPSKLTTPSSLPNPPSVDTTVLPVFRLSFSLSLWKNWVQIVIILIEFVQLFSMALDGGRALRAAGIDLIPVYVLDSLTIMKNVLWQFGMDVDNSESFITGFGVLVSFGSLYILLCGIFIALDLTVDSWLAPLHFTLLAGGFYGSITSGLLFLILYSQDSGHTIVGLLMLAYYSSTAVFVSIYRSDLKKTDRGEIRIIPVFIAIERVSKGILAACTVAVDPVNLQAKPALVLAFGIYLSILMLYMKPYSVFGVTALRLTSLLICAWTGLVCLVASAASTTSDHSLLFTCLILGWCTIPIGTFCASKIKNIPDDVEEELEPMEKEGVVATNSFAMYPTVKVASSTDETLNPTVVTGNTMDPVVMKNSIGDPSNILHSNGTPSYSNIVLPNPLSINDPSVPVLSKNHHHHHHDPTNVREKITVTSSTSVTSEPNSRKKKTIVENSSTVIHTPEEEEEEAVIMAPEISEQDNVTLSSIYASSLQTNITLHSTSPSDPSELIIHSGGERISSASDNPPFSHPAKNNNNNVWLKHEDEEGDIWYTRADDTEESVWEVPKGAIVYSATEWYQRYHR